MRSAQRQATSSRTEDARRVARKIGGDARRLNDLYDCMSETKLKEYVHDFQLAMAEDVLEGLTIYLEVSDTVEEAYEYVVTDGGTVASSHIGRLDYRWELAGSTLRFQLHLRDGARPRWDELKASGLTKIRWSPCERVNLSHLGTEKDGQYNSGQVGVTRCRRR